MVIGSALRIRNNFGGTIAGTPTTVSFHMYAILLSLVYREAGSVNCETRVSRVPPTGGSRSRLEFRVFLESRSFSVNRTAKSAAMLHMLVGLLQERWIVSTISFDIRTRF